MQTRQTKPDPPPPGRLCRQRRFKVALDDPQGFDCERIDDWLRHAFEIETPALAPAPRGAVADTSPLHLQRLAFAQRVLLVWAELLRAARVPVFAPGRALEIACNSAPGWTATFSIAHIDEIDASCYQGALRAAVEILHWCASRSRTVAGVEALHTRLEAQVLPGLRRGVGAGDSTIPVLRAAHERGIPFLHLSGGIYQLGWGRRAARIDRSMTDRDAALGAKLALNKLWSAALLRMAGLPAPQHLAVRTVQQAASAAAALGWPVVVKPADTDRGEGVTVGIAGEAALTAAVERALARSPNGSAIVERQAPGVCHRLFIARGRLLYAVKRLPIAAIGDGLKSVSELIAAANARERGRPPWLRKGLLPSDTLAVEAMAAAGFTVASVPAPGQAVPLRDIESTEWGGVDEDVTLRIHPDNLAVAIGAAKLFGLDSAGIDLISPDIARPWHENGAIINEVNFAPLLGGGEISRSHLQEFLGRLLQGDGRIPTEAVVGEAAGMTLAIRRQRELNDAGLRCYVTSGRETRAPSGELIRVPFDGLAARCRALLLNDDVGALVLAIDDDAVLETGLPIDRLDRVTCVPDPHVVRYADGLRLSAEGLARLLVALTPDGVPNPGAPGLR